MDRRLFLNTSCAGGLGALGLAGCGKSAADRAAAGDTLKVIRVAPHGTWGSNKATGLMGILQSQELLEKEFAPDGIAIDWKPMDGGGIGINEAIANGLLDFSSFGGLPMLIGRARGLKTRILASQGYHYNYFAVRSKLPAKTVADLKGATLGVGFGGYGHLSLALLLKEHGVRLADVKLVNMGGTDAIAALAAGRIDGHLGGPTLFPLEAQGLVRIIETTRGRKTHASGFGALFCTEDFAQRHPDVLRRFVKAYLQAVHWVSLAENREAYFEYNTRNSTTPIEYLRRDFAGRDLKEAFNPLVDEDLVERYREAATFCLANGIIRNPVTVEDWFDRESIRQALAELGLQNYWTAWKADGTPSA